MLEVIKGIKGKGITMGGMHHRHDRGTKRTPGKGTELIGIIIICIRTGGFGFICVGVTIWLFLPHYCCCSVNSAFTALRTLIPTEPRDRKLSKIETLRLATSYIAHLATQLLAGNLKNNTFQEFLSQERIIRF